MREIWNPQGESRRSKKNVQIGGRNRRRSRRDSYLMQDENKGVDKKCCRLERGVAVIYF